MTDMHLRVGDAFRITPHTIHYMEAVTDCDVLEASTPELDDVVRLTDRYGREGNERAMKVIIPLAGKGTRLRPHTHLTPKPMLKVAGKPVISYLLDDLKSLGGIEQIIYITGHLKEKVEEYARKDYDFPAVFVEQTVQNGTATAVDLARPYVDQPVLIIFVDTIFDADLSLVQHSTDADGIIWVKEVEDYQRFGVVVTDANGFMTKIVEKPTTPISKRANIGLYYIKNWKLLYEGISYVMKQPSNKGEYYLTDAFQYMIEHGAKIKVVDVEGMVRRGEARHAARHQSRDARARPGAQTGDGARWLEDHRSGLHRGRRGAHRCDGGAECVDPRGRGDRAV